MIDGWFGASSYIDPMDRTPTQLQRLLKHQQVHQPKPLDVATACSDRTVVCCIKDGFFVCVIQQSLSSWGLPKRPHWSRHSRARRPTFIRGTRAGAWRQQGRTRLIRSGRANEGITLVACVVHTLVEDLLRTSIEEKRARMAADLDDDVVEDDSGRLLTSHGRPNFPVALPSFPPSEYPNDDAFEIQRLREEVMNLKEELMDLKDELLVSEAKCFGLEVEKMKLRFELVKILQHQASAPDAATLQETEGVRTSVTSQEHDMTETSSRSNLLPGLAATSNTTRPDPIVLPVVAWHPDCLASQYEQNRTPRVPPSGKLRYAVAALRREAQCPVCMEVLTQARFVKACNHQFCATCIGQAVRANKVCPMCRTRVRSVRSGTGEAGELNQFLYTLVGPIVRGDM